MNIQSTIEITISAQSIDLFYAIKDFASKNSLIIAEHTYGEIACGANTSPNPPSDSGVISKTIKVTGVVLTATATFLIQAQPTIQEAIKANTLKEMTFSCGDKKIEIKGENDYEKAIAILKEFNCDN